MLLVVVVGVRIILVCVIILVQSPLTLFVLLLPLCGLAIAILPGADEVVEVLKTTSAQEQAPDLFVNLFTVAPRPSRVAELACQTWFEQKSALILERSCCTNVASFLKFGEVI